MSPAAVSICRTGYIPAERVIPDARPGGMIVTERGVGWHCGLPAEVSSLVGRGAEIAAVLDGLRAARVVTLTGPGGCGKTRLALRAATLAAGSFEDGAGWSSWPRSPMPRSFRRPSPRRWEFRNEMPPTRWRAWCGRWPAASC